MKIIIDRDETRTRNLLIRSQTPYPLGHTASRFYDEVNANSSCMVFSSNLNSDREERCENNGPFFIQTTCESEREKVIKRIDHDETRTRNLLIRSQTPYPLGHTAIDGYYVAYANIYCIAFSFKHITYIMLSSTKNMK